MALVERVVGERLDDVEQRGAQVAAVAGCLTPRHEFLSLLGDQFPDLLPAVVDEEILDDRVRSIRVLHPKVEALLLADVFDRCDRVP